jgi:hypothetical protein
MAVAFVLADCGGEPVEMLHLSVTQAGNDKLPSESPFAMNGLEVRDMCLAFPNPETSGGIQNCNAAASGLRFHDHSWAEMKLWFERLA